METIVIKKAQEKDVDRLYDMLGQVQNLHAEGRPDVFKKGAHKYGKQEIIELLTKKNFHVDVAVAGDQAIGYVFCEVIEKEQTDNLFALKTYYIDDLCVDEKFRGKGVGRALYQFAKRDAQKKGCDSLTLNVWELNQSAKNFYQKIGMGVLKTVMETRLN